MATNKQLYDLRLKRINDSIALKEPDTVPLIPIAQCYPYIHAGYTMVDILYDTDLSKSRESIFKFLDEYSPDYMLGHSYVHAGCGPMYELARPKTVRWAGMPGDIIDRNSIHQFIEFPILLEDEFDEFMRDRTGWFVTKAMARTTELLEPMAKWNLASNTMFGGHLGLAQTLSSPETKKMIETLWKINELNEANMALVNQFDEDIEEKGFPVLAKALAGVPYDNYSDMFRGTLDGMMDMMMREELVLQFCREDLVKTKEYIKILGKLFPGRHVFMPLHKGMDTFMNPEQYRTFYWNDLREIIHTIIEVGLVPYIYTEGGYDTRLECLREVPKGKVLYHFEKVDMVNAKKILGGTACISGGFPTYLLDHGTKQQVIDEVKRLIDGCAAGGGYIFSTACGIDYAKPENVEAMVDTVRAYGKH